MGSVLIGSEYPIKDTLFFYAQNVDSCDPRRGVADGYAHPGQYRTSGQNVPKLHTGVSNAYFLRLGD